MVALCKLSAATAVLVFHMWLGAASAAAAGARRAAQEACMPVPANLTFDYVVVGSGAGGMPVADRLSEAGHSVLLLEKGPVSTGDWGGTMGPAWLAGSGLTRFDVPGLCDEIWRDAAGVACTDTDQMAGCVLGGGTAVNAGLWWKPHPLDWTGNFPAGWHADEMTNATARLFARIAGTTRPSADGRRYLQQGFDMLGAGLQAQGWTFVVANDQPDQKNWTFGHSAFMFADGQRSGPLATYLATAHTRPSFALWTNSEATRIVRTGGHATAVEVACLSPDKAGYVGRVSLTPGTGRVVVAAGAFGSAKLLLRSGIGPADQLGIVQRSADGPAMISSDQWIDLPVGYNLNDHVATDIELAHPDVVSYDFYGAWDQPIPSDRDMYLGNRSGILAQAAPNLGPTFWQTVLGADGIVRHLQWQARVEGSTSTSMTITQYLGTGSVSRGRMVITDSLDTRVAVPPYLRDNYDKEAVLQGVDNLVKSLSTVQNLTWIRPPPNVSVADYVNSIPAQPAQRGANHWIGTAKMGLDDGRSGGTAVVDTDTKVYGTDNIFVVDASIFPGQITSNPSAAIAIAAEHASRKIMALPPPSLEITQ